MSTPEEAPRVSTPLPLSTARFAALALFLGALGFGGGYVVMGRMKRALVDDRGWIDEAAFVEDMAVANALPGTIAANLFTLVGYRLGGLAPAIAGTVSYALPSIVLMATFAAIYDHLRSLRILEGALDGMSAAMVGVVAAMVLELRNGSIRRSRDWLVAVPAAVALATRALTLLEVVVLAGMVGIVGMRPRTPRVTEKAAIWLILPAIASGALPAVVLLFLVFAKIGAATFGGGLAMIPAIAREVAARHWIDDHAFADAMALSQITPGPIATCATFIGYRVAGLAGAVSATLGVFVPPFVVTIFAARSLASFRESEILQGFLRGIAAAVVGIIAAATYALFMVAVHSPLALGIAVGAFVLRLLLPRTSPVLPLAIAALIGGALK